MWLKAIIPFMQVSGYHDLIYLDAVKHNNLKLKNNALEPLFNCMQFEV